jgi:hypothetical protein
MLKKNFDINTLVLTKKHPSEWKNLWFILRFACATTLATTAIMHHDIPAPIG